MLNYDYVIAVSIGAVLGALLRWGVEILTNSLFYNIFLGTLLVNLVGCFLIGFAIALFSLNEYSDAVKLFIVVGFLGSFTTFSSFSLEIVYLLKDSKFAFAGLVVAMNVVGSILMTFLGIMLVYWFKKL